MEIAFFPNFIMKYICLDYSKQYQFNILLSNICIISFFVIFRYKIIDLMSSIPHFCLFKKLIGIDCPFCGITRGLVELANGNFAQSINYNYCSILIATFIILQLPMRLFAISFKKHQIINSISEIFSFTIIFQVFFLWIFKIL